MQLPIKQRIVQPTGGKIQSFGLIGWPLLVSPDDSAWNGISFVAVLALAALVGITRR
jgi:hypothetical protein